MVHTWDPSTQEAEAETPGAEDYPQQSKMLKVKNSLNYKRKIIEPKPKRERERHSPNVRSQTLQRCPEARFCLPVSPHSLAITLLHKTFTLKIRELSDLTQPPPSHPLSIALF